MNTKIYSLHHPLDLAEHINGYEIRSCSIGFDQNIYVLLVNKLPERIDGMFVQTQTATFLNYKVLTIVDDVVSAFEVPNVSFNYHYIQPFGMNYYLLVGARSMYIDDEQAERNGRIIDVHGRTIKEILLGDGIEKVQTTKSGEIWTSYFDEGVFGNYGWDDPIGSAGLVAFDEDGNQVFRNAQADICDCYALNVVNDHVVWFYYYADFQLGKISNKQMQFFDPKHAGASGFLVYGNYFLFDGGYEKHAEYVLMTLHDEKGFRKNMIFEFFNEEQKRISRALRDFRGDLLILLEGTKLYRVYLWELLNEQKRTI